MPAVGSASTEMVAWRGWHRRLIAILNGNMGARHRRLIAEFAPELVLRGAIEEVAKEYDPQAWPRPLSAPRMELSMGPYTGHCEVALAMCREMEMDWAENLVFACVHGSVGTNEVIPYSDFDGLLVLKNEAILDPARLLRVAQGIRRTTKLMYEHDPLQHHGWFVLPEAALFGWPEDYLPVESLAEAKRLSDRPLDPLALPLVYEPDVMEQQFESLCVSLARESASGLYRKNQYQLKSHLSKVMLMPCLFLQVIREVGINKRDSFCEARPKFSEEQWSAIEQASALRTAWKTPKLPLPAVARRPGRLGAIVRKKCSPALDEHLLSATGEAFARDVQTLIGAMREKVRETKLN